jgi:hypothetical protein
MSSQVSINSVREAAVNADKTISSKLTSESKDIKAKVKQRAGKRQSATKTITKIEAEIPETEADIKFYTVKLSGILDSLVGLDDEIETFMLTSDLWDDCAYESQTEISEVYSDILNKTITNLNVKLACINRPSSSNTDHSGFETGTTKLKLPQIELPKFDGQPESFDRFISSFEEILSKFKLSQFEKYSYLLTQVRGPARQIVESVPAGSLNYDTAKALLSDAFSSKIVQQYSVITKIANLKLNSIADIYKWVSETRILKEQVERLNIDSSLFVQFFVWNSLSEKFRTQFVNVTNKAKPSLQEILDSSFEVFNRLKDAAPAASSSYSNISPNVAQVSSVALATNVSYPQDIKPFKNNSGCFLCKFETVSNYENHKITNCPKFRTPDEKLNIINKHNGCTKCGYFNHQIEDCTYRFSGKCVKCNRFHAYFLCNVISSNAHPKSNNSGNKNSKIVTNSNNYNKNKVNSHTSTNLVEFSVMHTSSNNNAQIPTFTSSFKGENSAILRCMYDPASQTSFISEDGFHKLNPPIIQENVHVKIGGFNKSKTLVTKIVQLETTLRKVHKFNAVVVPLIKTKIKTNLKTITDKFEKAGIVLADGHLDGGDAGTIDILLGVDSAHILPVHSCSFGKVGSPSTFYYTCLGVMLAGDLCTLESNLPHLHMVKSFIDKFNNFS